MTVYIDSDFKCHITNTDGNYTEVESSFFDGKCDAFIEGYRYVPSGKSWTRSDGVVFAGEMIAPWNNHSKLYTAQRDYERELLEQYESEIAEYEAEIAELDAVILEMQYQALTEDL